MSRLRITCKSPSPPERREFVPGCPVTFSTPASWTDVFVTLIDDDGAEHEITNIEGITWRVKAGTECAGATIDFVDVDVEVEAELSPAEAEFLRRADGAKPIAILHPEASR